MNRYLIPKRIELWNFRGYLEDSTPDFPDHGLCIVKGDSGSGKSGILYALAYALSSLSKASSHQCKFTKDPMQVQVTFDSHLGEVVIRRGKVNSIKVGNEPEIAGAVGAVENRLEQLIGVKLNLIEALTFRKQRKPGLFLSLTDAKKKEFLSAVLSLDSVETNTKEAGKKIGVLEKEVAVLQKAIEIHQSHLVEPQEPQVKYDALHYATAQGAAVTEVKNLTEELAKLKIPPKNIVLYEADKKAMSAKHKTEQADIDAKYAELLNQISDTIDKSESEKLDKEIFRLLGEVSLYKKYISGNNGYIHQLVNERQGVELVINQAKAMQSKIDNRRKLIEEAEKQTCPTCEQQWTTAPLDELKAGLDKMLELQASGLKRENEVAGYNKSIAEETAKRDVNSISLTERENQLISLKTQLEVAKTKEKAAQKEISNKKALIVSQLNSSLNELKTKQMQEMWIVDLELDKAKVQWTNSINDCTNRLTTAKATLADLRTEEERERKHAEQAMADYTEKLSKFNSLSSEIAGLDIKRLGLLNQINVEKDVQESLKAYLGSIFDEILAEITVEANELMKMFPNVATYTVELKSDRLKGDGALEQSINCVVYKSGVPFSVEENCSGGQQSSVELAVDLATRRVILRRTQSPIKWLVLDESFEGHNMKVKEGCLEMLKTYSNDELVVIVDHASELSDYFDFSIKVGNDGDFSRIEK